MLTLSRITREPLASFFDRLDAFDWRYNGATTGWTPAVDVVEGVDATRITAEVPGVKPEQLQIAVEGNTLSIRGSKGEVEFARTFTFPASVDAAGITAAYEHGVLTVTLPKAEQAKPRQIAVEVAKR
jgi:HSP20 family protein